MYDSEYILDMFKQLEDNIEKQMFDDPKFTFIDRLTKHLQNELGWSKQNATDFAISFNYNVNDAGRAVKEYDDIEQTLFRVIVKVIRCFAERFPNASVQGLISAASSMEFELNL